jgi:hypothetical protein
MATEVPLPGIPEGGVGAAALESFVACAQFADAHVLHDGDTVGVMRQTVRADQGLFTGPADATESSTPNCSAADAASPGGTPAGSDRNVAQHPHGAPLHRSSITGGRPALACGDWLETWPSDPTQVGVPHRLRPVHARRREPSTGLGGWCRSRTRSREPHSFAGQQNGAAGMGTGRGGSGAGDYRGGV